MRPDKIEAMRAGMMIWSMICAVAAIAGVMVALANRDHFAIDPFVVVAVILSAISAWLVPMTCFAAFAVYFQVVPPEVVKERKSDGKDAFRHSPPEG